MTGTQPASRRAAPRGSLSLTVLSLLSTLSTLPLSLLSRQLGDGIVAVVIGIPCAAVGVVVSVAPRVSAPVVSSIEPGITSSISTNTTSTAPRVAARATSAMSWAARPSAPRRW